MVRMFLPVWTLLLFAASISASSWRKDYAVDRLLRSVGIETTPLEDISFDVDYNNSLSSRFVEFHLENGTLGNLRRRVQRLGSCDLKDERHERAPQFRLCCTLSMRGLVAQYDIETITDRQSKNVAVEIPVGSGATHTCIDWFFDNCTKCTKYDYRTLNLTAKLIPPKTPMGFLTTVANEFQKEVLSRVEKEIIMAIERAYMPALEEKMTTLNVADLTSQPRLHE
uniref:Putative secreted protein n=1 Tax=Amblyomma triste TaxID=251400 RepID=A0A023G333_AMBTT